MTVSNECREAARRSRRMGLRVLALALFFVVVLGGCEEAVNPILESDRNYTLFGTLDMQQDTQFVRVERIREVLDPGEAAPLPITFTSTDLELGTEVVWRDSIINFEDGTTGHVFYAPLRLVGGHSYRIEIEDPSEAVPTWAVTEVPDVVRAAVFPESVGGGVGGAIGSGSQRIVWTNLDRRPYSIETWYRFMVAERTPFVDVVLPYEPLNTIEGDDLEITLDLRKDRLTLDTLVQVREYPLMGVGVQITVLDKAFVPPGGVFDPDILMQPGTLSNVRNGFGFVGSVARFSAEWVLSPESMERLDYVSLESRFGKRAPEVRREVYQASGTEESRHRDHPRLQ